MISQIFPNSSKSMIFAEEFYTRNTILFQINDGEEYDKETQGIC